MHGAFPSNGPRPIPSRNRAPHQRCLSTTSKPYARIGEACPLTADTRRLESAQRSWRTIESTGRDARGLLVRADGKRFANHVFLCDRNDRRQNTGKIRMQGAAGIGQCATVIVVIMRLSLIGAILCMIAVVVRMVIVIVRSWGRCRRHGVRARGRDNARELSDQEQADQQTDNPAYHTQRLHECLKCPS